MFRIAHGEVSHGNGGGYDVLTISPGTFSRMASADLEVFVRKLSDFIRQNVPGMSAEPPDRMRTQILALKKDANSYGLQTEQGIAAYAVTAAFLGVNFPDRFAGARKILFARETEERKAELLSAFTITLFEALAGQRA